MATSFRYLAAQKWSEELLRQYLDLVKKIPLSLDAGDGAKVLNGLRYHVLDVWIDGFAECEAVPLDKVMEPVECLRFARSKILRNRAKDVLADERLPEVKIFKTCGDVDQTVTVDDFNGFD